MGMQENLFSGFLTRSDTNQPKAQKLESLGFLARLHEVHRAIVVTSVVRVYVYVRVTLSVKVFLEVYISCHVDGSS